MSYGSRLDSNNFSEDSNRHEFTEMKEQMYQVKLSHLKRQLELLNEGKLPEYIRRFRRLETTYRERMRISEVIHDLEVDMVEQDYINEKRSAARELEDKQRMIETERHNMELTGDSMELKPIITRKL